MPNWCQNFLMISHEDTAQIKRAVEAYARGELMQEFDPCPQELLDTMKGSHFAGSPEQLDLEARSAANVEKYGFANWYDWCVANWGTKWDVGDKDGPEYTEGDTDVTFRFDSAWSPPLVFYATLEDQGFRVTALYYESGMAFCGRYTDGSDESYEITGDSNWVTENIPEEIDLEFAISENMDLWEQENEGD